MVVIDNIHHRPIFNTKLIEKKYSKDEGVPVKYVCTSAITSSATWAYDIFFRNTPNPKFGNRYFGLTYHPHRFGEHSRVYITDADNIENLDFSLAWDEEESIWEYSQHRHDFNTFADTFIDGGREYSRTNQDTLLIQAKIKDGRFIQVF